MLLTRRSLLGAAVMTMSAHAAPRRLAYEVWDVFTDRPLTGNPLAVFLDARGLSDDDMRAITREMNLSETVFVFPPYTDAVKARIFTPVEELPFAGHPVLGTAFALRSGRALVKLDLRAGVIPVSFDGAYGEMAQNAPVFGLSHTAADLAALVGLPASEIGPDAQTVSTGRARIIVPLTSLRALQSVQLDHKAIAAHCARTDKAAGLYLVTKDTGDASVRARARMIGPTAEDPVTGSAGGNFAAWMVAHGWAKSGERVVVSQGTEVKRPGRMFMSAVQENGVVGSVRVGGNAVRVLQGTLTF